MDTKDTNKRDFDREAKTWDIPPRIKLAEDIAEALSVKIPLESTMDVLDFGCGTGLLSLAIHKKVRSVTGVDTSKKMIEVFERKLLKEGITNIKPLYTGNIRTWTIPEEVYNLVMSSMTMHHIEDIKTYFQKFHDALVPGGYIAIADLDEEGGTFHGNSNGVFHSGFSRRDLEDILSGIGFKDMYNKTAAEVAKPDSMGTIRKFTVFLITGKKQM